MTKGKYIRTEEHRQRRSTMEKTRLQERGRNPNFTMAGKKHSEVSKKKMSEYHKGNPVKHWLGKTPTHMVGSKNPSYIDGRYPEKARLRKSREYELWRKSVYERDNYTCVWCGARGEKGKRVQLNADHIKPFADYPELRFAIDNGRTLCVPCHKTTDSYMNRWQKKV